MISIVKPNWKSVYYLLYYGNIINFCVCVYDNEAGVRFEAFFIHP